MTLSEPARLTLAPDRAAVRQARAFVNDRCREAGLDDDLCDSAMLLVSETVTNAFIHGRSEARLTVTATGPHSRPGLRVEVGDDNSRHPHPVAQDDDALDGRGLAILEMLSARWGVRDEAYGKTVWFELQP